MSSNVKQVIVVRHDLHMRMGKVAAQASHASIAWLTNRTMKTGWPPPEGQAYRAYCKVPTTEAEYVWLTDRFTKICVRVDSEQELLDIHAKAIEAGLVCHLIQDAGLTEFGGVATYTCLAVGPDYSEKLDPITGHLTLL